MKITLAEEKKMLTRPGYRTPARTLRRLAAGYMIFELAPAEAGRWDDFQVRKIGLAVQRRMARNFDGAAERIRQRTVKDVTGALEVPATAWKPSELRVLTHLAPVFALIPNLVDWSTVDKNQIVKIIRDKASANESTYLRALQEHPRLRAEIIKIGS